jgi:shikimate dehydrogenase
MSLPNLPIVLCGSISHHPGPLGSKIHRAGYQALGLEWTYVPFRVTDLEGAIRGMKALGIRGFGVSMPFKAQVMAHLDHIEPLARRIGAVNTVVNNEGVLSGYNADAHGAAEALAEATEIAGKRILVVGAGGAARAVVHGLKDRGGIVHVVNRNPAAAAEVAAAVGGTSGPLSELSGLDGFEVAVNCTPIGMADSPGTVFPAEWLRQELVVMDIVYKPVQTELLALARARGCRTVHGGSMLLHQAFRQMELYTLQKPPREAMKRALDDYLKG